MITYIEKGSILKCPSCKINIYEVTKDLRINELIRADHFKGIGTFLDPRPYQKFDCPNCGISLHTRLHEYIVNPAKLLSEESSFRLKEDELEHTRHLNKFRMVIND